MPHPSEEMHQRIAHIALVFKDYDEAIEFYTKKLDFELIEDSRLSEEKRWVLVAPKGENSVVSYLQRPRMKNKQRALGTKPVVEFSYSFSPMTFGGTSSR